MAVTTSQVTTASNGDLAINPNGSGKLKFSKLTGGTLPTGVLSDGTVQHFRVDQLADGGTLATNSVVMIQKNGETVVKKASISEVISSGGGVKFGDLSVSTGSASGGGALAYNSSNGVFTFNPASLSAMGGISLTSLTVQTGSADGGGSLQYNNATGVFTFKPADLSSAGVDLTAFSVSTGTASGGGSLSYNNSTGVFSFAPAKLSDVTYTAGSGLSLASNAFAINLSPLPTR